MDVSSRRRLIISYQTTDQAIWQRIQPDFIAQLPLRNLHWKTASRSLRTIQSLDIDLRAFQTLPAEQAQQIPPSLLERPYLHLLFVACDDNEVYRSTIRQTIREWLDAVTTRRNQEWLIVHVATAKVGPSKFYQRKGTVADKIRADFNVGKRERVPQLVLGATGAADDPVLWAELISKIKDSIITTFDANVVSFEEEVRKSDSQRALPGWNFCTFFIQKEGLALSFEAMNLLEDALIQYDELEASFFQSLRENTLVWFGKLGGTAEGDDSLDLFSANAKPYRDLIKNNAISLFDFRVYLFARQGSLLGRLGRTLEIAKRGTAFVGSLGFSLRQQQSLLDSDFVAAWTYSAATQIVHHCNRSLASTGVNGAGSEAHYAIRAELLDLACKQLTKIGMAHKFLPVEEPFSGSLDEEPPAPASPIVDPTRSPHKTVISQPDISAALLDGTKFHDMFGKSLMHTYGDYLASRRHRAADRIQALMAAHDRLCHRNEAALKRLADLSVSYNSPHWSRLESSLLANLGTLQSEQADHKEQLLTTLSLLRAGSTLRSSRWDVVLPNSRKSLVEVASDWISDLRSLSLELEKDFAAIAFPTFEVRLASETGRREAGSDTLLIDVIVSNHLPCPVPADDVRLKLTTTSGEHIWFASGPCEIAAGSARLVCRSSANAAGICHLETTQIRLSKVVFQYAHRQPQRDLAPDIKRMPQTLSPQQTVHFALDPLGIHFQLRESSKVAITEARSVVVRLAAGRSDIGEALLSLSVPEHAIRFNWSSAKVQGGSQVVVAVTKHGVKILNLMRQQTVDIEIAFSMDTSAPSTEVQLDLAYTGQGGPQLSKHTRASLPLALDLPLAVSVQDHFRRNKALSCFNISTSERSGLRIQKVKIEGAQAVSPSHPDAHPIVVSPDHPARFVFAFSPPKKQLALSGSPNLVVLYRRIGQEVKEHIRGALRASTAAHSVLPRPLLDEVAEALASSVESDRDYLLFDRLRLRAFDREHWNRQLRTFYGDIELVNDLLSAIEAVSRLESIPTDADVPWRTLQIPIELPSMPIVCQASVNLPEDCQRLIAGQLVKATVKLKAVFTWTGDSALFQELRSRPQRLSYDVTADLSDWVIAGSKKGEFESQEDELTSIDITLVPLRVGRLFLPRVVVSAVSADTSAAPSVETYQANAAQQIDVLPAESRSTFIVDL